MLHKMLHKSIVIYLLKYHCLYDLQTGANDSGSTCFRSLSGVTNNRNNLVHVIAAQRGKERRARNHSCRHYKKHLPRPPMVEVSTLVTATLTGK